MKIEEEPEVMKILRKIREKHFEETKNMTPDEQIAYDRAKVEEFMRRHDLKLRVLSKSKA